MCMDFEYKPNRRKTSPKKSRYSVTHVKYSLTFEHARWFVGCGLNNSQFSMSLYRWGCQIWNRIYDLCLFWGRNSGFGFQYAIDEHLPVYICTKPKKENIRGPNRRRTRIAGPDSSTQWDLYWYIHWAEWHNFVFLH